MEIVSGNIFLRKNMGLSRGNVVAGHTHNFDHTTIVFTGAVHVKAKLPDGRVIERDFQSPSHFLVRKEVEHELTALEDNTSFWCVYSHRTPQGEVIEEHDGWMEAYQ